LAKEKEERRLARLKVLEDQKADTIKRRQEQKEKELLEKQQLAEYMKPREDLEITDSKPLPELPLMETVLDDAADVGNCLAVMQFIRLFGPALELDRQIEHDFSFADLCAAVLETSPLGLLGDIVMHLVVSVLDEDCEGEGGQPIPFLRMALRDVQLDTNTVSAVLLAFLCSHRASDFREEELIVRLQSGSFFSLSTKDKLTVLNYLCEQLTSHTAVQNCMVEAEDRANKLRAQFRDERSEAVATRRKRIRELKAELVEKMKLAEAEGATATEGATQPDVAKLPKPMYAQLQQEYRESTRQEEDDFKRTMDARESEVQNQLWELEAVYRGVQPLGSDRFFRRFWVCQATPGLLIEPAEQSASEVAATDTSFSAVAEGLTSGWQVIMAPEHLDTLQQHLNSRGLREHDLGEELAKFKALVAERIRAPEMHAPATAMEVEVGMREHACSMLLCVCSPDTLSAASMC